MKKSELEERLIAFAVICIEISRKMEEDKAGAHLMGQIIRSSASCALNYGEAQSGESRKDFIHKMKIVLKELRETNVNLKIISGINICTDKVQLESALLECEQLISIFYKSIDTARKNARPGKI